jgi:ATP-dependent DNA helicase RecG
MKIDTIDFESLKETHDVECKAAQGRDGQGELPKDFWESYSAMANTDGGSIFLGIAEKDHEFTLLGIREMDKVVKDLVNMANNREKVSVNLLSNDDIVTHQQGTLIFIEIKVRRASRKERPVYLKKTPIGNSYRRRHEADQRMSDDEVKRMLADQQYDSLDHRILKGFDLKDLDKQSLADFRQSVAVRSAGSNFDALSDLAFLKQIGGWKKDRESGEEGLTVAGLLMFGSYQSIRDEFAHYFVDYQEMDISESSPRYLDRVCPDGTWSGNLYDFYRKVYPKLVSGLKVGFKLKDGVREADSPAHVAIREAFVNALIHADYSISTSVLVAKRPDLFGFKNPGLMRIPLEVAMRGGESDSRNKSVQDMFRMIGAGERQGHGIRKILEGWKQFDWRIPHFEEKDEQTPRVVVTLSMLSLFPEDVVQMLSSQYKGRWEQFSELEKIGYILAWTEGAVTHARLSQFSVEHPRDVSKTLLDLEKEGALASTGQFRAKTYHIPGHVLPTSDDVFSSPNNELSSLNNELSSPNLDASYPNLDTSYPNLDASSPNLDDYGRIVHPQFEYPLIDSLGKLKPEFRLQLEAIAQGPRTKKKIPREAMIEVILKLCSKQFVTTGALSELLKRDAETLRGQYLSK